MKLAAEHRRLMEYRGPESAMCVPLPTVRFCNTWSWGYPDGPKADVQSKPRMHLSDATKLVPVLQIEHPTVGTHKLYADEIRQWLFTENETSTDRPFGGHRKLQNDPHWWDWIVFSEYFHQDNGSGAGASHQTGWTGLVAKLIQQSGGDINAAAAMADTGHEER